MKIPKRVNAALDWMGHNVRVVAAVGAALIISILTWSLVPALSAFVLGLAVGGTVVHRRMALRQASLRSDIDDLLRQNGALRREKLTLASGVIAKQTQLTAKLPVIPEDSPPGGDTGDLSAVPVARTDPTAGSPAGEAMPTARVDSTLPGAEAPVNPAVRTQPDAAAQSAAAQSAAGQSAAEAEPPASRTAMFPAVPDETDDDQPTESPNVTRADPSARTKRPAKKNKKTTRLPAVPDDDDA